jgi:hypothetical protein
MTDRQDERRACERQEAANREAEREARIQERRQKRMEEAMTALKDISDKDINDIFSAINLQYANDSVEIVSRGPSNVLLVTYKGTSEV